MNGKTLGTHLILMGRVREGATADGKEDPTDRPKKWRGEFVPGMQSAVAGVNGRKEEITLVNDNHDSQKSIRRGSYIEHKGRGRAELRDLP